MGTVVVGVDGSPAARAALAWAADHAALRGAGLRVVTVYRGTDEPNPHDVGAAGGEVGTTHLQQQAAAASDWRDEHDRWSRDQAEQRMKAMVADLDGAVPESMELSAVKGRRPSRALIDAADGAQLLVVGTRGRGGFSGLVLGSVSQQLAGHAPCPVAIIPDPSRPG